MKKTNPGLIKDPFPQTQNYSVGSRTKEWIISEAICPPLAEKNIFAVGMTDAAVGYSFVRSGWAGSVLLACISGRGEVLVDGRWNVCRPGMVYLAPAQKLHAYRAIRGVRWGLCWVLFREPEAQASVMALSAPKLISTNPRTLESAIQGLHEETSGANEPAVTERWGELVHLLALRMIGPLRNDMLWPLWKTVESDLAFPWTQTQLARRAGMSRESLRTVCSKSTGRSSMKQVTFLRMQRAAFLLTTTAQRINEIASAVGYNSEFAFSSAFKRCMGASPVHYRKGRRTGNAW